jgi:hypothetical protein
VRTGLGDEADFAGSFAITLKPGQAYELCVFEEDHGPLTTDPIRRACLTVHCLWKRPEERNLITDHNEAVGGTWYARQTHTNVPTSIVAIGVSRTPPVVDADGIPHLKSPEGAPTSALTTTQNHFVELNPLRPGNHYFFLVLVTDSFGNWDFEEAELTTHRRKLSVGFPTIHIFNDGDPGTYGEGEFWFRVYFGTPPQPQIIEEFHLPTQDVDDWGETDRPYSIGIAHVGGFEVVKPGEENVWVGSRGIEHDGVFENDEQAWSLDTMLPIPAGRFVETVTNSTFFMDCPTATVGDDFHFGVDVKWSVDYAP